MNEELKKMRRKKLKDKNENISILGRISVQKKERKKETKKERKKNILGRISV